MSADIDKPNLNQPPGPRLAIDPVGSLDIDAQQVDHLLIVKAFADDLDLVETVNRLVPTQMGVKPGIIVLGLVLDTLTGRSHLYCLVEFYEGRNTEFLLGERVAASMFNDDTVGRVLDLLFEAGTRRLFSELAMKAVLNHEIATRAVHFDSTSVSVHGEYRVDQANPPPFEIIPPQAGLQQGPPPGSQAVPDLNAVWSVIRFPSLARMKMATVPTSSSTTPFSAGSANTWHGSGWARRRLSISPIPLW